MSVRDNTGADVAVSIDGIDAESGMSRAGGTFVSYLRTLSVFLRDGREKVKRIGECLEADNLRLFTITVHALKSASANIGAEALSEAARALEEAGKAEDRAFIRENTGRLLADLESLLGGIDVVIRAEREKLSRTVVMDREAVKATLAKLNAAIDDLDPDAINAAASELRQLWAAAELGGEIENILQKTLVGEHDEAISLIEKILEQRD